MALLLCLGRRRRTDTRSFATPPGVIAGCALMPPTALGRLVRVPSGAQHQEAVGLRKRRSAASLRSSIVDSKCSESDPLFRNGPDRSASVRAAPGRPVSIMAWTARPRVYCGHGCGSSLVGCPHGPASPARLRPLDRGAVEGWDGSRRGQASDFASEDGRHASGAARARPSCDGRLGPSRHMASWGAATPRAGGGPSETRYRQ